MSCICVDIYFPNEFKDSMVDTLLELGFDDFFYFRCSKYASSSMLISAKEQVSARKDYGNFRIFIDDIKYRILQDGIYSRFGDNSHIKIYTARVDSV